MPRSPRSAVLGSWLGAGFLTLPLHIIAPAKHTHVHNCSHIALHTFSPQCEMPSWTGVA